MTTKWFSHPSTVSSFCRDSLRWLTNKKKKKKNIIAAVGLSQGVKRSAYQLTTGPGLTPGQGMGFGSRLLKEEDPELVEDRGMISQ